MTTLSHVWKALTFLITVTGFWICATCHAATDLSPVDQFRSRTAFVRLTCGMKAEGILLDNQRKKLNGTGKASRDWAVVRGCIEKGKADALSPFPAALRSISSRPNAQTLLKDYYASWLSVLDMAIPLPTEYDDSAYRRRQRLAKERTETIWNRQRVELI